jgi:hypothetical protein
VINVQTKENSLLDLLEAKTLTLTQTDRLLAQYRTRIAQYEAEVSQQQDLFITIFIFICPKRQHNKLSNVHTSKQNVAQRIPWIHSYLVYNRLHKLIDVNDDDD